MRRKRACDLCYKKKIQCDGDGDQCDWCIHHNLVCTYNRPTKKRTASGVGTSDQSLSKRIERLELILNAAKQLADSQDGEPPANNNNNNGSNKDSGLAEASIASNLDRQLHISDSVETGEPGETLVGVAATPSGEDAGPSQVFHLGRFYLAGFHIGGIGSRNCLPSFSDAGYDWIRSRTGEEPSFHRLRELEEHFGRPSSLKSRSSPAGSSPAASSQSPGAATSSTLPKSASATATPTEVVLPSRSLVEEIAAQFWVCDSYQVFPISDPALFKKTIDDVYGTNQCSKLQLDVARANMFSFLAATSLMDGMCDLQPAQNTDAYASLATRSVMCLIAEPGLSQCGTLISLALFHALSGHEYQATMLHSLACRALIMLNAHTLSPRVPPGDPVDMARHQIYLRRLFWMSYTMDKEISSRSGLAPSYSDEFLDLTLPLAPYGQFPSDDDEHAPDWGAASLPGHLSQSILKSRICRLLYSESAFRKTEVEILYDVRQLDEELEQWRLQVPLGKRPRLHTPDGDADPPATDMDPTTQIDDTHVLMAKLGYYHLLSTVHRASGRCRAWPGMDAGELEGISSSLAISTQASRMTLICLRNAGPVINRHAFWVLVFYPMSSVLAIFCNILLDPLDPQVTADLDEIAAMPGVLRRLRQRPDSSQDEAFLKMAEELCAELVRLGKCAVAKAQAARNDTIVVQ